MRSWKTVALMVLAIIVLFVASVDSSAYGQNVQVTVGGDANAIATPVPQPAQVVVQVPQVPAVQPVLVLKRGLFRWKIKPAVVVRSPLYWHCGPAGCYPVIVPLRLSLP